MPINESNDDDHQPQPESKSTTKEQSPILRRSSQVRKQTKFIQPTLSGKSHAYTIMSEQSNYSAFVASASPGAKDTYKWDEVMVMDNKQQWIESAEVEITQLAEARDTWDIVPISDAGKAKVLPTTWVFRLKTYPDGTVKKYKARLVIRGDLQEGVSEVFAPVVDFTTVRLFLAFALKNGWSTAAIDFVNAFC